MQPQTNGANTSTWREASDVKINAYIENRVSTLNLRQSPFPTADLHDLLKRISEPRSEQCARISEPGLEREFQAWDELSDEALRNFELGL